jgi:DNA-binding transcriptional ArsR family regulator
MTYAYNNGVSTQTVSRDVQGTGVAPALIVLNPTPSFDFGAVANGSINDKIVVLGVIGQVDEVGVKDKVFERLDEKGIKSLALAQSADGLNISASLVSHHLRLLRAARLLQADRRGRQVFYVVGDSHIRSMLTDMVDHVAEGEVEAESAPGG